MPLRPFISAVLLSLVVARPGSAQLPADRPTFLALLSDLGATTSLGSLPPDSRCDALKGDPARLCQGLIAERRGELSGSPEDARHADDLLVRTVTDHDDWPYAWYGLGINRLSLARLKVLSHEGPQLGTGLSNEAGGANALVQALKLEPGFIPAANALALTPIPREGSAALKERVALLRQLRRALSPEATAMAALFEREAGDIDSAIALQRRALATGKVDSGVVLLDLARNLYRIGESEQGHAALIAGAATESVAARNAYRSELLWVASPAELIEWDSLSPGSRSSWIRAFWSRRDVADGRKDGERLVEHYRRIEYSMAHYRITLPQSGRQQSLTTAESGEYMDEYAARREITRGTAIPVGDALRRSGNGISLSQGEILSEFLTFVGMSRTEGSEATKRYYRPVQDQLDDRGIAYVRQGPPDKVAATTGGESLELWRYDRPGGPLLLHFREADFDGSTAATVLVPTFISLPVPLRNQVCYLEPTECPLSQRFQPFQTAKGMTVPQIMVAVATEVHREGERLGPEAIVRSANKGKKDIDLATNTDAFSREFTHKVIPSVQIFGLDQASGGAPRLVVAFAIPGDQLAHATMVGGDGKAIYPVRLQLMAARERDGLRVDLDTTRQLVTATPLTDQQYLTGTIELPAPAGRYGVSLVVTQNDGRGAVAHLGTVVVPASSSRLVASDLVFGRAGSGARWNSGTTMVALNPLNTWSSGIDAEVYFQLSGLKANESYSTKFEFFRSTDDPNRAPRLTISGTQVAHSDRMEVSRSLGLKNLEPGRYRVTMTTTGGGMSATATSYLTIVNQPSR